MVMTHKPAAAGSSEVPVQRAVALLPGAVAVAEPGGKRVAGILSKPWDGSPLRHRRSFVPGHLAVVGIGAVEQSIRTTFPKNHKGGIG